MEINKNTLSTFRADFEHAVAELESKYNVKISQGKIGYTDAEFNMKITVVSNDEKAVESKKSNLDSYARSAGIPFGKSFTETKYKASNGKIFMVKEIKYNNHKYPMIATCIQDGKSYKLSVEQVRNAVIVL